jgi:hypothetical protein
MTAAELLIELNRRGIRLEADGDRLRYHPRSAVTPDLEARLKYQKPSLLAALRGEPGALVRLLDAAELWQAALDRLKDDLDFDADEMAALRTANVQWAPCEP